MDSDHPLKGFSLAHYRFVLNPQTSIHMPPTGKGNVLRGAFGATLRRLVCVAPQQRGCAGCDQAPRCAYHLIFDPVDLHTAKRMHNVPRGFVIKPPLEATTQYTASHPLVFDMILIGDRRNYIPWIVVPFAQLGKSGIGINRGRFQLGEISIIKDGQAEPVYDPYTNTFTNKEVLITGEEIISHAQRLDPHHITIEFLTPTRLRYNPTGKKGESILVRAPEFHHLIRRLRDRISTLAAAYCGAPLKIDFAGIAARAMGVRVEERSLNWVAQQRRSKSQGGITHDQSGFIGRITFAGELREFLPFILLGEYTHVGEDAVFGNGWYRIMS